LFPQGEFRDWPEIDALAKTIVQALKTQQV
jgi:hypothetical protein